MKYNFFKKPSVKKVIVNELKWAFVTITWSFIYYIILYLIFWISNLLQCKSNSECWDAFVEIEAFCTYGWCLIIPISVFVILLFARLIYLPVFYLIKKFNGNSKEELTEKNNPVQSGSELPVIDKKIKSFYFMRKAYLLGTIFSFVFLAVLVVNQKTFGLGTFEVSYLSFAIWQLVGIIKFPFIISVLISQNPGILLYLVIILLPFLLSHLSRKYVWISLILFTLGCFLFFAASWGLSVYINQAN